MIISFAVLKLFRLFRPEPTGASAAPNNRRRGKRTNHDRRPGSGQIFISFPGQIMERKNLPAVRMPGQLQIIVPIRKFFQIGIMRKQNPIIVMTAAFERPFEINLIKRAESGIQIGNAADIQTGIFQMLAAVHQHLKTMAAKIAQPQVKTVV